jgi:hypothetical protein
VLLNPHVSLPYLPLAFGILVLTYRVILHPLNRMTQRRCVTPFDRNTFDLAAKCRWWKW